jgi:hypothetical protein
MLTASAVVTIAVASCGTGSSGSSSSAASSSQQAAVAYIKSLGREATQVQVNLQVVQIDVGSKTDINRLAQDAQQAHDNLDTMRNDFAYQQDSGHLGDAELEVFAAANDLKNAMGALVSYTGDSNPATLAQFTTKYQSAVGEWNDGVRTIWRTAKRRHPPTL